MIKVMGTISGNKPEQHPGWYFVSLDIDFSSYYAWMTRTKWNIPLNGCHITFISGNREKRIIQKEEMDKYIGTEVGVWYDPIVMTNSESFWIDCLCPHLTEIRNELGLGAPYRSNYHITLGNFKNGCLK
jgi:hypothetical protein